MALKTPVQRSNCVIMSSSRTCEVSSKSPLYVSRRWTLILFRIAASVELQRVSSAQNAARPTAKHALKGDTVGLERKIMKYSSSRGQLQMHSRYLSLSTMQTKKVILFGAQLNSIYSLPFVLHFQLTSLHGWQEKVIAAVLDGRNSVVIQPTGSGKSLCF